MRLVWDFGLASKPSAFFHFSSSIRFSIGNLQTVPTGRSCLVSNYALQPKHLTKELKSSLRLVNALKSKVLRNHFDLGRENEVPSY